MSEGDTGNRKIGAFTCFPHPVNSSALEGNRPYSVTPCLVTWACIHAKLVKGKDAARNWERGPSSGLGLAQEPAFVPASEEVLTASELRAPKENDTPTPCHPEDDEGKLASGYPTHQMISRSEDVTSPQPHPFARTCPSDVFWATADTSNPCRARPCVLLLTVEDAPSHLLVPVGSCPPPRHCSLLFAHHFLVIEHRTAVTSSGKHLFL